MASRHATAARSSGSMTSAAQQRHDQLMRVYRDAYASSNTSVVSHDMAVLQRHFQFIRDDEADLERGERDWEVRMSVRYYRKLFREYALADLSRYKEGKVGLRWRTEMEVVAGKGQFMCGNKICDARTGLHSYELLFAYVEHGEQKRCLVKVRVCEACARKLFYRKLKEAAAKEKKKAHSKKRRSRDDSSDDEEDDSDSSTGRRHKKHKRTKRSKRGGGDQIESKRRDRTERDGEEESIHARCAAINVAETSHAQGLRRVEEDDQDEGNAKEKKELARLLL